MTKRQLQRWRSFAKRLAVHAHPHLTERRRTRIAREVQTAIDYLTNSINPRAIVDWDSSTDREPYVCDELPSYLEERGFQRWQERLGEFRGRFGNAISCCVRAGLDMATRKGGGVLGYTVGDLRRMYPRGIPAWVQANFGSALLTAADDDGVWL